MVNKLEINKDPLNNALRLISGKWKIKILEKLINKTIRFGKPVSYTHLRAHET